MAYGGHEGYAPRHLAPGKHLVPDREGFSGTAGMHIDHRDQIEDESLRRSVPSEPGQGVRLGKRGTGLPKPGGIMQRPAGQPASRPAGHLSDLGHLGEALLAIPLDPPLSRPPQTCTAASAT
ncbi:hypothetical protein [Streptomyces bauhiniae]|uniref:hypothetical protein n=1 Tax=Streptomyces bauhiniae TaxID=2340725 RepID=UPI0035E2CE9E